MAETGGDKTEKATPRKKQKARGEGQVANSRELSSVAVLLASLLVFYFGAPWMLNLIIEMCHSNFVLIGQIALDEGTLPIIGVSVGKAMFMIVAPLALTILVFGVTANVGQVGWSPTAKPIMPKLEKINPISGLKKLFSLRALVELVKSLIKITLVTVISYDVISDSFDSMLAFGLLEITDIVGQTGIIALRIMWNVTLAILVLALLDLAYQRYDNEKKLKMTKQEVKDEHKAIDGNPQIKSRQRRIQLEMANRRMMADVPKADVVLTNPTHIAIAIKYNALENPAPLVLAKGAGYLALKIREKAIQFGVPVLERPPLAREIYNSVKLGEAIPISLYEAMAEILAYIYNLKGKKQR